MKETKIESPVVGMFIGDLHWSENAPAARSVESDWMKVQLGYMEQLRTWQVKNGAPIYIAGDLFDKWNSSAYLISNAIEWLKALKDVYTIAGNHDTPNHNYRDLPRSAYWTLVEAGVVKHISPCGTYEEGELSVTGFSFGFEPGPTDVKSDIQLRVALVHGYIWTKDTGHANASESYRYAEWIKRLKGYDVAFFGDNHKHFLMAPVKDRCTVMNCGSFMRRHSDEVNHKPCIGMLHSDGTITREYLDVSKDQFADVKEQTDLISTTLDMDLSEYVKDMAELHSEPVLFDKVVRRWIEKNKPEPAVKELMLKAISGKGK